CGQMGFLAFVRNDFDLARDWYGKMYQADSRSRHLGGMGVGNAYSRLLHGLDRKAFRHASAEEMAAFENPKRRFVILLADFHADCEQPDQAEPLYRAMLGGRFGRLGRAEEAYVRFQIGWICWYRGIDRLNRKLMDEAVEWFLPFLSDANLRRTPTAPRAVFSLYNTMRYSRDPMRREAAYEVLKTIPDDFPSYPRAETALYTLAYRARKYGGSSGANEAVRYLRRLLKDYPRTFYRRDAEEMIREIEQEETPKT
ncbi:MAG: hypothetical protein U1E27_00825, partial [Kiritimatiellia bacterium]|nr:hypothetical protein [Kiritimatiellia bacterium]